MNTALAHNPGIRSITTLSDVASRVHDLSKGCTDRHVPVKDISFENLETVKLNGDTHALTPIAQGSIANRLGIPIQYLKKCPESVQAFNLNHWIKKEKNEELFFRFDGDEVRAVFTPRYKPADNVAVLERLFSMDYSPNQPVQCNIDKQFMSLSILIKEGNFRINGDQFTPGISISNSEVGLASLGIAAFCLRLICTNGMVSSTQVCDSFKHVSENLLDKLPDVINNMSHKLETEKEQFKISMKSKVDNPSSTIDSFNMQYQLGQLEKEAVEWAFLWEHGHTIFHIVNTYTKAAQFSKLTAESQFRLQKVGGNILSMLN